MQIKLLGGMLNETQKIICHSDISVLYVHTDAGGGNGGGGKCTRYNTG